MPRDEAEDNFGMADEGEYGEDEDNAGGGDDGAWIGDGDGVVGGDNDGAVATQTISELQGHGTHNKMASGDGLQFR